MDCRFDQRNLIVDWVSQDPEAGVAFQEAHHTVLAMRDGDYLVAGVAPPESFVPC